jgi:truncated hemoglobin YjbI
MPSTMGTFQHIRLGAAIRDNAMMQEAIRLAADGELGNSDAIRLLQVPHRPEDVKEVLQKLGTQLSREAKSKLTLDALVPRPNAIDNQRYEPIFDKYIVTGETYATASGAVVPNELQYYNGEMVQLYGECTNVAFVNDWLAGSSHKALAVEHADGRETAVAQLWANRFTDSTIGPYGAMFIVVVAIGSDTPRSLASIRADPNGASSVLPMLDGVFDPTTRVYENKARLFMIRLLDTTQIAIEVGRERMGTDKRPGTLDIRRDGRHLSLSIKDQHGRCVVRGKLGLADDSTAYLPEVTKAAATAGISLRVLPNGTEYAYPAVARIGQGPLVSWQWRSDLAPRLQPVMPNAVVFDSSSEEGRILSTWGFTPKVLGYIPNVRGVVTGLAQDQSRRHADAPSDGIRTLERDRVSLLSNAGLRPDADRARVARRSLAVNHRARDGSVMSWGTAEAPAPPMIVDPGASVPITVAVSPIRPGHIVSVEYRVNGGPLRYVTASPELLTQGLNTRLFRAILPGQTGGLVEFLPVLRFVGQPISPRLEESGEVLKYKVGPSVAEVDAENSTTAAAAPRHVKPHWAWDATFLGTLVASLRKEVVGVTPDGFRIDWYVTEGNFVGPEIDLVVLPGAADWMRIRKDGVAIVNVHACFETRTGVRIYGSYGGLFDLGHDGYARALRDEFDPLPPVVVTPTYATADARFAWLNRAQCIGVGRVDMKALRVEFDVYVVRVGGRAQEGGSDQNRFIRPIVGEPASLYKRMGGYDVIAPMANDFIDWIVADKQLKRLFVSGYTEEKMKVIRRHVVEFLCEITGGPCFYTGRDMKTAHEGLGITESDWTVSINLLTAALNKYRIAPQEQAEFMQIIEGMKGTIIENPEKR